MVDFNKHQKSANPVVSVLCSDLHLSHKPPIARSAEPDWYAAMARPLAELTAAAKAHDVPVICAGDIFDKWNVPPELITFAIQHLPPGMYCIPGQHDLPYHDYAEAKRSAYGTLVKAGTVKDLKPGRIHLNMNLAFCAFPWGHKVAPWAGEFPGYTKLAVIHEYCWVEGKNFPGASPGQRADAFRKKLKGFDCAVFGDNHKPFDTCAGDCVVFNHGTMLRRKADERNYKTGYGLLHRDGSVTRVRYDTSQDVWLDDSPEVREVEAVEGHLTDFLSVLKETEVQDFSFTDALDTYLKTYDVSEGARRLLLKHD